MIGSSAGLKWTIPTTLVGWFVYIVSKLLVSGLNMLIFHCFVLQGKVNIKDNANYKKALEMLATQEEKEVVPRSPKQYYKEIYGKKSLAIFVTTMLSAVGLTQAVLTFSVLDMLTYLFTILMGIIFGLLQMNGVEEYSTSEMLQYATMKASEAPTMEERVGGSIETPTQQQDGSEGL